MKPAPYKAGYYTGAWVATDYAGLEPPKDGKQEDPHNEEIVHPLTGHNWPPDNERLVYPQYVADVNIKVRELPFRLNVSMYLSSVLGCHSLALNNLVGRLDVNGLGCADIATIRKTWGFAASDSGGWLDSAYYTHLCSSKVSQAQKVFVNEVNDALYQWVHDNILKGKVLFFMSDRLNHSKSGGYYRGIGVSGLVNYLTRVKKWPCVASPVVANPNYFYGNATLCQGWILANRYENGKDHGPRLAVDGSYSRNFDGMPTLADMKQHFIDKPVVGYTAPYRQWEYMTGDWEELMLRD